MKSAPYAMRHCYPFYAVVCICHCQIPRLSPHFYPDNHKSIFCICDCFVNKSIRAILKVIPHDMSLSDLLYSVWQYQGPSNVASDGIISLLFMTNILLYIYVPHLFYSFFCWWTFRLLPCFVYCKQCCREHWACMYCFNLWFPLDIFPGEGLHNHMLELYF